MSDVAKHRRGYWTSNALSAQHDTTGIAPGVLMLSQQSCLYAARRSSRAETLPLKEFVPQGYGAGQGPGPGVVSKKPDTVPVNTDEVVVPVVLTTTTKFEFPGTVNEYDAFGTVVPKPTTPLSPR
jgi:hypothetical protein